MTSFKIAYCQHNDRAHKDENFEIINLFSAFYAAVSKRFTTFIADITKIQTVRQSTGQIFSVGVPSIMRYFSASFLYLTSYVNIPFSSFPTKCNFIAGCRM